MNTPDTRPATASIAPATAPKRQRGTRTAAVLAALVLLGGLGGGALWHWSGREGSLATSLKVAQTLPALQALQLRKVQGNLREGGRIGSLQWQQDGLQLQLQDLAFTLDWARLWQGQLPLGRLEIGQLQGHSSTVSRTPSRPPASLLLPLAVDLPWQIRHIEWQGPVSLQAGPAQGHYRYRQERHEWQVQALQWAGGQYTAEGQVQARAPMLLTAHLQGQVQAKQPGQRPALPLRVEARLEGTLADARDRLALKAQVQNASTPSKALLDLQADLHPWQAQPLQALLAQMQELDLAPLWPGAPVTALSGDIQAQPDSGAWSLQTRLRNERPGPWDQQRLPLRELQARLDLRADGGQLHSLNAQIGTGSLSASGSWHDSHWQGRMQLRDVQAGQLHTALAGPALSGQLLAEQVAPGRVRLDGDLRPATIPSGLEAGDHLLLRGEWTAARWTLERLSARLAGASLQGQGQWTPVSQRVEGELQLQAPGLQASARGRLAPTQGQGQLQLESTDWRRTRTWLQRWSTLAPGLRQGPTDGDLSLRLDWQGGWRNPDAPVQATLQSRDLGFDSAVAYNGRLQNLKLQLQGTPADLQARLSSRWQQGQQAGQAWQLEGQWQARQQRPEQARKQTGPHEPLRWEGQWQLARLERVAGKASPGASMPLALQLQQPVRWQWQPDLALIEWDAMRWLLQGDGPRPARLDIDAGQWRTAPGARGEPVGPAGSPVQARLQDLPVAWAAAFGWPLLQGGLQLQADVQLQQLHPLQLNATLQRQGGDVAVRTDLAGASLLQAGVREASARLRLQEEQAELMLDWASEQAGQAQARVQARRAAGQDWAQATLGGQVQALWPRVGAWSWLAPPGWRVQGSMEARFDLGGTLSRPRWDGRLQADQLALRSAVQGVEFSQGKLQARLQEQRMVLEHLSLRGAGAQGGELFGEGTLQWPEDPSAASLRDVRMDLRLQSRGLRVSNRADRRLAVSGDVQARLERGQMRLRGRLMADQAWFVLPEDTTPRLGEDVRLDQPTAAPASAASGAASATPPGPSLMDTPDVQVTLDLGPDFQLRGQGVTTRLAGSLQLASSAATQGLPRLQGEVRTEGGRYKAYGQQLEIEQGVLRFAGPYDNPALDILALRPNISQRVGVRVSGTARAPRLRLYADPEMPDADKLAWLVLGRSPGGGGAESAVLQQAALALLGGSGKGLGTELANALGLDTIGIAPTSTENATGAAITLGKRLSKDFYLAYESSVSGTFGSLFIFYDLSRRLTLRAQAGDLNALDLVYTVRKD